MQRGYMGWTRALPALASAKSALTDFTDAHRWWASLAAFALLLIGFAGLGSTLFVSNINSRHGLVVPEARAVSLAFDADAARRQVPAAEPVTSSAERDVALLVPAPQAAPAGGEPASAVAEPAPTTETKTVELSPGDTLMAVLVDVGVTRTDAHNAIEAMREKLDPRTIKPGQTLNVTMQVAPEDARADLVAEDGAAPEPFTPRLAELTVQADPERKLQVTRDDTDAFAVREVMTELSEDFVHAAGRIDSSLFLAADALGIPATTIVELIRMYSYDVDFQREVRSGDEFEIFYTRYLDDAGEPVKDGVIEFGSLTLSGKRKALYRYTTPDDDITDYYDEQGRSAKKFLMKTPVDGARLSSGFGKRKHPILGYTKMHKGVDFAAPRGTPVMAGGDGIIEKASPNGSYGNYVLIRHNNGYKTAYGHLNGFAKGIKPGTRVEQGQIIAYVGTTGQSTGPHLHYEILQNGSQVNPITIRVPTGRTLDGNVLQAYLDARSDLEVRMASVPTITSVTTAQAELDDPVSELKTIARR